MGPKVREMIETEAIVWIELLVEDAAGDSAQLANGQAWYAAYPVPKAIVLTEDDVHDAPVMMGAQCYPTIFVIDPEQRIEGLEDCQSWSQLQAMVQKYG